MILLRDVLTHAVNQGYAEAEGEVVERVDGQRIRNLRQLVTLAEEGDGPWVTFGYRSASLRPPRSASERRLADAQAGGGR